MPDYLYSNMNNSLKNIYTKYTIYFVFFQGWTFKMKINILITVRINNKNSIDNNNNIHHLGMHYVKHYSYDCNWKTVILQITLITLYYYNNRFIIIIWFNWHVYKYYKFKHRMNFRELIFLNSVFFLFS